MSLNGSMREEICTRGNLSHTPQMPTHSGNAVRRTTTQPYLYSACLTTARYLLVRGSKFCSLQHQEGAPKCPCTQKDKHKRETMSVKPLEAVWRNLCVCVGVRVFMCMCVCMCACVRVRAYGRVCVRACVCESVCACERACV